MRKVGRNKIIDQTVKRETSDQTKEIKQVLQQKLPIEDAIAFSDAEHEKESNRYWFNYPSTWRTITNQDLILGLRSTSIQTNYQPFIVFKPKFRVIIKYNEVDINTIFAPVLNIEKYWYGYALINMITLKLEEAFNDFFKEVGFPTNIVTFVTLFNDEIFEPIYYLEPSENEPVYNHARNGNYTLSLYLRQDFMLMEYSNMTLSVEYLNIGHIQNTDMAFNFIAQSVEYYELERPDSNIHIRLPHIITPIVNTIKPEHIVLTASFANQSKDNYIGKGSNIYTPIKQYPISSADTKFWIDVNIIESWRSAHKLFSEYIPVELNEFQLTGSLIEIQLITQDRSQYI